MQAVAALIIGWACGRSSGRNWEGVGKGVNGELGLRYEY
jgi:hypothetical protein